MRVHTPFNRPLNFSFNFSWNAASNLIAWPDNWSTEHLLQSLDGGNVAQTLDKWLSTEDGFDQCGAMYGQIIIDGGDNEIVQNTIEVNLPGVRRVRFGDPNRIGSYSTEQSATVIGVGRDGTVFVLSSAITDECNEYISHFTFRIQFSISTLFYSQRVFWICPMGEWRRFACRTQ